MDLKNENVLYDLNLWQESEIYQWCDSLEIILDELETHSDWQPFYIKICWKRLVRVEVSIPKWEKISRENVFKTIEGRKQFQLDLEHISILVSTLRQKLTQRTNMISFEDDEIHSTLAEMEAEMKKSKKTKQL